MMLGSESILMIGALGLAGLGIAIVAALKGWQGWLEVRRLEIARSFGDNLMPSGGGGRIEIEEIKERVRKPGDRRGDRISIHPRRLCAALIGKTRGRRMSRPAKRIVLEQMAGRRGRHEDMGRDASVDRQIVDRPQIQANSKPYNGLSVPAAVTVWQSHAPPRRGIEFPRVPVNRQQRSGGICGAVRSLDRRVG